MGLQKVAFNFMVERGGKLVKSLLCTKLQKAVTSFKGLKYVPALEKDSIQISKKLIPANNSLFSWATKKPKLTFDRIDPESLVLVRMTNEFPKNGEMLSTYAIKDVNGLSYPRTTLHFTLNRSVTEDLTRLKWDTMDYAIISPFSSTLKDVPCSKIIGGIQEDFILLDRVKLPQGSTIVKYNPDIPEGQLLVSDVFEGIKMIETSNRNVGETANLVVEKMGYTNSYKALEQFLSLDKGETLPFLTRNEEDIRRFIKEITGSKCLKERINNIKESISSYERAIENSDDELFKFQLVEFLERDKLALEKWEILEKYYDKLKLYEKSWANFCKTNNYINKKHCETPLMKFDVSIMLTDAVGILNKNSWGNYKTRILKILNNALSEYPENKYSCIDYNKVKNIIEESLNPQIAMEKLKYEFGIKSSPQLYESQNLEHIFEEYELCFN